VAVAGGDDDGADRLVQLANKRTPTSVIVAMGTWRPMARMLIPRMCLPNLSDAGARPQWLDDLRQMIFTSNARRVYRLG
jgi:hypothetical protein